MSITHKDVIKELQKLANPEKAKFVAGYFKTGKGQYGEGDIFLGLTVPDQRKIAKRYTDLSLSEIQKLLSDKIHEYRLTALEILVFKYKKAASKKERKVIYDFYLKNKKHINNWDLVDGTSRDIVGAYLYEENADRSILYKLAASKSIWDRRIAIISTHYFIYKDDYRDTQKLAGIFMEDTHDLMHKAVGWMLREMGKRSRSILVTFLKKYYQKMPRTMLRYSIEHFDGAQRMAYLKGKI